MMETIAIEPIRALDAVVSIPGSKSYTQRALIIAALAEGPSRLSHFLTSEDTTYLIDALQALGATIRREKKFEQDELVIEGIAGRIARPSSPVYLGNNGTAMRFLTTLVALGKGHYTLTGDPRLCERPVGALLAALKALGVDARSERNNGCPPVIIDADGLAGGEIRLKDIESSQFVSSLLIAAPYAAKNMAVILEGRTVSMPYIDMTVEVMRHFGATVSTPAPDRFEISSGKAYRGRDYAIEGDVSSASYFFLAAALCRGKVRVLNVNPATHQGDIGALTIMESFGCTAVRGDRWIEVEGKPMQSGDLVIDMGNLPDMVPTIAVLAAFRKGRTQITNAAHLRLKESNRIESVLTELRRIGCPVEETADGMIIDGGGPLHGAEIETYNDHRIAMSFAIAGLAVPGMVIRNPRCVGKSFPGFWEELDRIAVNSQQ